MKILLYRFKSNGKIKYVEEMNDVSYQRVISDPDIIFNYNTNDENGSFAFVYDSEKDELPKDLLEYVLPIAIGRKFIKLECIVNALEDIVDSLSDLSDDVDSLKDEFDQFIKEDTW